ncbi:MAG TPA: protein kinase [Kofleriaceae bacterium]|nr:protein kinase [Kofleriaceae bacterium]
MTERTERIERIERTERTDPTPALTTRATVGVRFARMLASPLGVLVTIPVLVAAVGIAILLVGRDATRSTSNQMAERLLTTNATSVSSDVAFALDQADPVLEQLRSLADPARPVEDVLVRLHDLVVGRPGVAYASISFPDGTFRGAYLDEQREATQIPTQPPDEAGAAGDRAPRGATGTHVAVQESRISAHGTDRVRFAVEHGGLIPLRHETDHYDPRQRGFYQLAENTGARAWTEPYTFFASHETGITCTEPIYQVDQGTRTLRAVLTVDFDVGALSQYVARPVLDQARSIVYTRDGIVLAYPAADKRALPANDTLLRHEDLRDPALEALLAARQPSELTLSELAASDGTYLAAVAPVGGRRAGVRVPLDWYVATVVPVRTLLGPSHALERSAAIASAGALAIAVGLALVLAWNLVRMRRQVAQSRALARSAEARARELGSYRLVARLGAGGMGEVWRAEHRLLARSAAIKLIRPEAMHDPRSSDEIQERFRREAQTLASMRSRHTIAIYDYGVTDLGVFYYVMELLDGLDLESLVVRFGPQPPARVIQLLIQACASLAEAHDAGLFHRDIKPPNLFISRAADEVDIVKLLDFGIVQAVHEAEPRVHPAATVTLPRDPSEGLTDGTPKLTQIGAMLGTPGFMAPEQILGMQLDGRADLYALGCCAWWLLTGHEVFAREPGDAKILHRHIYDPIPNLAAQVPGVCPPALEAVIASCLAKEIADRPRDARALAQALRAIEIPAEAAWTAEHARAWWRAYRPEVPATGISTHEVQIIMPGRADQRPVAATSETAIAQTVMSAPLDDTGQHRATATSETAIAQTIAATPQIRDD